MSNCVFLAFDFNDCRWIIWFILIFMSALLDICILKCVYDYVPCSYPYPLNVLNNGKIHTMPYVGHYTINHVIHRLYLFR
jgi:hypothetical protein